MGPESGALEQGHGTGEKVGGSPALAGGVDGMPTTAARAAWFSAAFQSLAATRHHMHQQPLLAPLGPKRRSRSGKRSGVTGTMFI